MNTIAFVLTAISAPFFPIKGNDRHGARRVPQPCCDGK